MTSTQDVQQLGGPAAPRVLSVPSLRRLLRPGPTLVLLALLVGAASAPTGREAGAAGSSGDPGRSGAASARQVPGWQQETGPRPAVAVGPGTALPVAPSPVVLPLSPVVLVEPSGGQGTAVGVGADLWAAYRSAAGAVPVSCHLDPRLLAAIGQVESGSLAGRTLDSHHRAVPPVLGPVLDGNGYARIPDTDHGRWDGDPVWDRAVGPMQFIPSTWARWGVDANGDGVADPQEIEDASLSAADYLCAGGRDLSQPADLQAAILSYNHSASYLATVLALVPRMTPDALGTTLVGTGTAVPAALVVGPPSVPATTAAPASASTAVRPATTSRPATSPTTVAGSAAAAGTPAATRTGTGSPTTTATSTTAGSPPTAGSSPTTGTSTTTTATTPAGTGPTTAPTTSTTPTTSTSGTTGTTGTSSPSATTPACPSGSATGTATSGTPSPTSPSGTTSTTPTASCTTTADTAPTPVPSTSSATAAEATLLGRAGASSAG
ncbi:lytic murein transglycosylase [Pedococcus sp. NPDC057267]|uniref:lytic transglycosylase domain-containing protein n=1 Tax=Pedococcus sp. NPDC057267 TaxID=3346077 RepID=UPI0036413FFA